MSKIITKIKNIFLKENIKNIQEENTIIDNYTIVEFVAIPPDFDISYYLSLRESADIFQFKKVKLDQIIKIGDAVKYSPVFTTMHNSLLSASSCMYFLSIITELKLVLFKIHNPMRMNGNEYTEYINQYESTKNLYVRTQEVKHLSFVIINLFSMINQNVIDEALEIAQSLQKYQREVEEKMAGLK